MNRTYSKTVCVVALLVGLASGAVLAQTAKTTLHGRVTDPSAASIPGATVILTGEPKIRLQRITDAQGQYTFSDIPAGKFTISVTHDGFTPFEVEEYTVSGNTILDVPMTVQAEAQKITVTDQVGTQVSVDSDSNAGALVLRGKDLDALSDDPDQLQDDLQALAGPSAGPNGGQIFIDGYSNGTLPPKSSIREVRVNQNPFSAEFDRLGYGRIEIFTKPGTDRFHGQFMTMFGDNAFNARNPFSNDKPSFQSRIFDGNIAGPLSKKASFVVDAEHRGIDENAVIVATDPITLQPLSESVATPQGRWHVVPRVDLQITPANTLTMRYGWSQSTSENQGVGGFSLPERAYNSASTDHMVQLTETAIVSPTAINETRFQYRHSSSNQDGSIATPAIQVNDAFTTGSNQVGLASDIDNYWELQNITSKTSGKHAWKFGGRLRADSMRDVSPGNFGGTFIFNTLAQYEAGTPAEFRIAGGVPLAKVSQQDVGLFALDDWKLRPNFTLSYGLRYETQSNIHDWKDFSPRFSLAWGVDGGAKKTAKTVLRAGFGIFYDRISDSLTLNALRFNGVTQQQYIVSNPDFYSLYPAVPSLATLAADAVPLAIREKDSALRAPYILQSAISIDRQLPRNSTMSVTYTFSRGVHELRTRDINAALAGEPHPFGDADPQLQYESTGNMRQQQLITSLNTRFSRRVSLFGFYVLNYANSDTDGLGTNPADPYDLRTEWGPSSFDIRHRAFVGGSLTAPGRIFLSPFIQASSGAPFNITTGQDPYGDSIYTQRPAFATPTTPGAVDTPWGWLNPNPLSGDLIIPRNYGRGSAQFTINMRLTRTWGFGRRLESASSNSGPGGAGRPGGATFGAMGGGRGGRGGGPGGPGGMFGGDSTGRRFNLTLGIAARNLLNHVNYALPDGDMSAGPRFGQPLAIAGGFGASGSSNRRIDLQLRLTF